MAKHHHNHDKPAPVPAPVPVSDKVKLFSQRVGDIVIKLNGEIVVIKYRSVTEMGRAQAEALIAMHEAGELQIL